MLTNRRRRSLLIAAAALVFTLLAWGGPPSVAAAGLANPGFESGTLDGDPVNWTPTSRRDAVRVVDAEGPGEFPVFADMGGVTVSPYKGDLMLRLGTPQRLDANQRRGPNSVASDPFTPTSPNLKVAFRVFSWEHRGQDLVKIDVTRGGTSLADAALAQNLLITTRPGGAGAPVHECIDIPCQFSIDVGGQGDFMDSGWMELQITNLPMTGGDLRVTYEVSGTGDSSKPTFAYFDNVNTPPVAKFTFDPNIPAENVPQAGDVLQFTDLSYDPDPGDQITSWFWTIDGTEVSLQNPFYVFGDEGAYDATLTVCDGEDCTSISDGGTANDGDPVPALVISNAAPLVDAQNVEALSGVEAVQIGRFADGDFEDTHTASFSNGATVTLEEEHDPLLSTGLALAGVTATSSQPATFTVSDDHTSVSDPFNITVLPDTPAQRQRFEPNDMMDDPLPSLNAGGSYISFLQRAGDIDLVEVRREDGTVFGPGDEVLVNLIDPPGDYDLTLLRLPAEGASLALSGESALPRVGFTDFEVDTQSFSELSFKGTSFKGTSFKGTSFKGTSFKGTSFKGTSFKGTSFKGTSFKGTSFKGTGTEVIATDMSLAELGLGSIGGSGIQVADFSAGRGLGSELVYGVSAAAGTRFFIAVTGHQGAHSLSPMSISVEAHEPPDLETLLGTACQGSPLVPTSAPQTPLYVYDDDNNPLTPAPPAETVFVVQWERLAAVNGLDAAGQSDLLNNYLIPLAQHPTVKGTIVSVASNIYNTSDEQRCNIDAVNNITTQIRNVIRDTDYSSADNVVLIGGHDVVPFRLVLDEGAIANESEYLADSYLEPGSKLYASLALGYVLEDNFYVDDVADPLGFDLPERSIGRLVESDDDIKAQVNAYLGSNGVLAPTTGFASGFDFFDDGANAVADELDAALPGTVDRLITPGTTGGWTADELRCRFLGQGTTGCATPDVNSLNAHFTHYLAPSALGYNTENPLDRLTNADVVAAQASAPGRVVFSMGCHSGFNVPDADSLTDGGLGVFPGDDFPEVFRTAIFVGNTGFGLGNDAGVGGAEELMRLYAEKLLEGSSNAGQALTDAKNEYIDSLLTVTDYDLKTALQATLYGMPTYTVIPAEGAAVAEAMTLQSVPVVETFTLTTVDPTDDAGGAPAETTYNYTEVPSDAGTHFTLDDPVTPGDEAGAQATPGRAIQPKASSSLEERHPHSGGPPSPYRGVLLTGGAYTDIPDFNPNIANIQNDWLPSGEPQVCQTGFWPAEQAALNGDTFVAVSGQFQCVPGADSEVSGVERLWSNQAYLIESCQSSDGIAAAIESIDLEPGLVTVNASDPDGIKLISVLLLANGGIQREVLDVPASDKFNESFEVPVQNLTQETEIVVQVLTYGCDVTTWTAKGAGLNFIPVDAGPDRLALPGETVTLNPRVTGFTGLVDPVTFLIDWGDGSFTDGILAPSELATVAVTIDPSCSEPAVCDATFNVQHSYATLPQAATVRVYDSAGGTGADDVRFLCDPAGDAEGPDGDWTGCGSSNNGSTMTISVTVDGAITDQFQYRVYVDAGKYNSKKKKWEGAPDGAFDAQLKYNGGQVTGLPSLTVQCAHEGEPVPCAVADELLYTFNLSEFDLSSGRVVAWYAETQSGTPGTGKIDRMPDAGWLSHTIQ